MCFLIFSAVRGLPFSLYPLPWFLACDFLELPFISLPFDFLTQRLYCHLLTPHLLWYPRFWQACIKTTNEIYVNSAMRFYYPWEVAMLFQSLKNNNIQAKILMACHTFHAFRCQLKIAISAYLQYRNCHRPPSFHALWLLGNLLISADFLFCSW